MHLPPATALLTTHKTVSFHLGEEVNIKLRLQTWDLVPITTVQQDWAETHGHYFQAGANGQSF